MLETNKRQRKKRDMRRSRWPTVRQMSAKLLGHWIVGMVENGTPQSLGHIDQPSTWQCARVVVEPKHNPIPERIRTLDGLAGCRRFRRSVTRRQERQGSRSYAAVACKLSFQFRQLAIPNDSQGGSPLAWFKCGLGGTFDCATRNQRRRMPQPRNPTEQSIDHFSHTTRCNRTPNESHPRSIRGNRGIKPLLFAATLREHRHRGPGIRISDVLYLASDISELRQLVLDPGYVPCIGLRDIGQRLPFA